MNKSIFNLTIIIVTLTVLSGQNSLEKQLREIDELRAKLKGLKSDETPIQKKTSDILPWNIIQQSWEMQLNGLDWVSELCLDEMHLWNSSSPVPHDIESISRNLSYKKNNSKMLFYDLKKTGTVFKEDFCIIYYYLTSEILSPSGKINKYENKISDILVKTGETWKIISRFEDMMQKQNEIER